MAKIHEIGQRGSGLQKTNLRKLTDQRSSEINSRINHLRRAGASNEDREMADKIENIWLEIQNSPNYTS